MKARLLAVQQTLWILMAVSLVLCLVAFPRGRNRDYMNALQELEAFNTSFQRQALEKSLLEYAQSQASVRLEDIAAAATPQSGGAKLHAKAGATPIVPRAQVSLGTLAEIMARSSNASSLPIGVPRAPELAASIAWRLQRLNAPGNYELTSISLVPAAISDSDITLEAEVVKAHTDMLAAQKAFDKATEDETAAQTLFDARKKWKATWKMILKANDSLKEAKATLTQKQAELTKQQARYESSAKKAGSFAANGGGDENHAGASVQLTGPDGKALTLQIPVAMELRTASLPGLQGAAFPRARGADLWDEVKDHTPSEAVALVRKHFTWQYQYVQLGGLKLGGMTLLHFLPLAPPVLLFILLLRIRRVSVSYNPFGVDDEGKLPRVGFGARVLDLVILAILPFGAAILAVVSLTAIAEIPVLPVVCALLSLGLGGYVFVELGSLQSLADAVVRSRSTPPPKSLP